MYGLIGVWLITIISSIGAFWRPEVGLYAYVFLATLRPYFLFGWAGSFANVSDIVGIAMIVSWALHGFGSWKLGRARSITVALALFAGWVWLSSTQALYPGPAQSWGIEVLKILAPFVVGVTTLTTPAKWRTLIWVIVITMGYLGFEMNMSYLRGYNQVADGYGGMDNNSFGIALVTAVGPGFALALTEKKVWLRWLATVCLAFILHTVLLTFSRGAFVGLLVVGVVTFVMMPKRPKYVLAFIVIGLVTLRFVGPQLLERYTSTFASEENLDDSASSRYVLWQNCIDVALKNPLLGIGPRNFPLIAHEYGWPLGKEAHSVWMQTLAETGFPGVTFLMLFFVLTFLRMWPLARARITDENRLETGVALGVMLGTVGFLVAGQFVSLTGLEVPYYVALAGAALLRNQEGPAPAVIRQVVPPSGPSPRKPLPLAVPPPATSEAQRKLRWI